MKQNVRITIASSRTKEIRGGDFYFYLVPGDLQELLLVFHLRGYCIKD